MSVPPRIKWLNHILPQGIAKWRLTSAEALEASARASTGNRTELTPASRSALQELLSSYQRDAQLHPLGEIMTAVNLLSLLKHQLRLSDHVQQSPGVIDRPIKAPLVITGLPRTGSTLLHNLLACDSRWRVPYSWEVTHPTPVPKTPAQTRRRIAATQLRFALIETLHPGFRAIHELDATLPQECLVITAPAMRSHLFFSSAYVPDYQDWLDAEEDTPVYDQHRLLLQHLQGNQPAEWALKAPSHLFSLEGLLKAYPDARIVHTQRAPESVIASIASLQWHLYRTFSSFTDTAELGRQVCNRWGAAHRAFESHLSASPELRARTFSLDYDQFVQDPIAGVASMYAFFKVVLSPDARRAMAEYLAGRPQQKFGRHQYDLADYGLTRENVLERFGR